MAGTCNDCCKLRLSVEVVIVLADYEKKNMEETGEDFFTISPNKVFVVSKASKGSQDDGTT